MRARIHETTSPWGLRLWLLILATLLFTAPLVVPAAAAFAPLLEGAGGLLALLAWVVRGRMRPRDAEIRLGFGWVEARSGQDSWSRFEGARLGGARIARAGEGASLAIAQRFGSPLLFELRDEADAMAVQIALGVSPATHADVGWAMERSALEKVANLLLAVSAVAWGCLIMTGLTPSGRWSTLPLDLPFLAMVVGLVGVLGAPLFAALGRVVRPEISLDIEGLRVGSSSSSPVVPYVLIADVKVVPEGLELSLRSLDDKVANHPRVVPLTGLSPVVRGHIATHVLAAARDAQGWGRGRRAETLRMLRRADGEPVAGWLGRIDALAPKQKGTPYREVAIEKKDLTQMIEDPASPRDVRIAATRMLCRIDPEAARPHLAALGAASAGDDEARQVQATVEAELDEAAAAYDDLRPAFRALRS